MESNSQIELRRSEARYRKTVLPFSVPTATANTAVDDFGTSAIDDRLARLERLAALGTLSAGLAHEIKNAMVAIRTFVDMLLAENKNAELAGIVQRELLRIDSIISQMLRCASQPKPAFVRLPLHEVLDRSLRLIEPQLRAQNIRLNRRYATAPDTVNGDAHQLEQAFLNLFLNAFDAIGHDGEISVTTSLIPAQIPQGKKEKTMDL